ncbi:MAG: bifunctional nicotinamidase/pyrazinamidase [Rhodobacteraceae bacterium]|nr:bifunctional nicotinamidase/pyrazinamidase [Paracoccaceae bacterium]MCY4198017.1 bifunctional nicotinamidase/pyrazinamidase [Paracoccaceae bacterium]MCY4327081.1 bifunctional nicotinamidase/pyrazinamidase [Paracoccaceae bacterium]
MASHPSLALLVIDVQNDFCAGGALEVMDGDAVVTGINAIMGEFDVTILTQDWHPAGHSSFASTYEEKAPFETVSLSYGEQTLWPDHCVQGSHGADFHPDLATDKADMILRKGFRPGIDSYSAFYENDRKTSTGLDGYLRSRNVDTVVCTGLATDFCVYYSAMDAVRLGFQVEVIENLCRAIDLDGSLATARADMQAADVILR